MDLLYLGTQAGRVISDQKTKYENEMFLFNYKSICLSKQQLSNK